jgi:hypothetical protein
MEFHNYDESLNSLEIVLVLVLDQPGRGSRTA